MCTTMCDMLGVCLKPGVCVKVVGDSDSLVQVWDDSLELRCEISWAPYKQQKSDLEIVESFEILRGPYGHDPNTTYRDSLKGSPHL